MVLKIKRAGQNGLLVAMLATIILAFYAVIAYAINRQFGYPLDDAWIHQTYARHFAESGRWEYAPGVISAGSTSPLWTLLLAFGYQLNLPHFLWVFVLGWLTLTWTGWAGMQLWANLWPRRADHNWLVGCLLLLIWPLIWAALSGMETLLFTALALQMIALYTGWIPDFDAERPPVIKLGLIGGLLILTRPDGLPLVLLIGVALLLALPERRLMLKNIALYGGITLLLLLPYFLFNLSLSDTLWPNTFYAKQAEYAFLWERSIIARFLNLLYFSLGGPAEGLLGLSGVRLLLLPGVLVAGWLALRLDWARRRLWHTLPLLWAGGHIFIYAWRLPVTYQHGRYLWPIVPVWILYGLAGWAHLSSWLKKRLPAPERAGFIWTAVTRLTFLLLLLFFLILGVQVYAQDVAFINGEMVTVAHWLRENTPPEAVIAAHDIGAIGYFAERPLLDLAGLISPEVIDLLGDEQQLTTYLLNSSADYLVTAPGWPYPQITESENSSLLYTTDFAWTVEQGFNNMAVYHLE